MTDLRADEGVRGRFWQPDGEVIVGTLRGTTLVLDGMLPGGPSPTAPAGQVIDQAMLGEVGVPVIHGELADGPLVTIVDLGRLAFLAEAFGATQEQQEWEATAVLVGGLVGPAELDQIDRFSFSTDYLSEWMDDPVRAVVPLDNNGLERAERGTVFESVDQDGNVIVGGRTVHQSHSVRPRQYKIEVRHRLEVHLAQPIGVGALLTDWLWPLENFLVLVTGRHNKLEGVWLRPVGYQHECEVIVRRATNDKPRSEKVHLPNAQPIPRASLPNVGEAIGRWRELWGQKSAAMKVLTAIPRAPFMYLENKFLSVLQAAEVLHREFYGGTPEPKDQFRNRVEQVVESVEDNDLAAWAEAILKGGNNLRLRDRLAALVASSPIELAPEIAEEFVAQSTKTRNALTHRSSEPSLGSEALHRATELWTWLIAAEVAAHLGADEERLREHYGSSPDASFVVRELSRQL